MTAVQGFIPPSRRPGELGIHSVDHFHFVVPDLAVAKNFYGEFGLDVGERSDIVTLKTFGHPHMWGSIGEGPRKKYGYVSFGALKTTSTASPSGCRPCELSASIRPPE